MPNLQANEKIVLNGLTFDDVLILPSYSEVLPSEINLETYLTRNIKINNPILSAAMDTVTESSTAIIMAQTGGLGIIHKNMSLEDQKNEIRKVKRYVSWLIRDPITVNSKTSIKKTIDLMTENSISGLPVVDSKKLVGIVTNRDIRFVSNYSLPISSVMTKKKDLVTVNQNISLSEAKKILHQHRIEKLLCVDDEFNFEGLITIKDIDKALQTPNASKDSEGRLLVGAAVGVSQDSLERAYGLVESGTDILLVDSAHGNSKNVIDLIKLFKKKLPDVPLIAGNVALEDGALALIKAGCDAVKVGIGPGSICTTRVVAGIGVSQISAIFDCAKVCKKYKIPLIADGGIKYSGDIVKAISAGADTVMLGNLLAGTDEAPGEKVFYHGRNYKQYRGMGSISAMRVGSSDRYLQADIPTNKYIPEGIEGMMPYKGPLADTIYQLIGGLRAGMGYSGCKDIYDLKTKTKMAVISQASLKESHVHTVLITKEAPNYRIINQDL